MRTPPLAGEPPRSAGELDTASRPTRWRSPLGRDQRPPTGEPGRGHWLARLASMLATGLLMVAAQLLGLAIGVALVWVIAVLLVG